MIPKQRNKIVISVVLLVLVLALVGVGIWLYVAKSSEQVAGDSADSAGNGLPPQEDTDSDGLVNADEDFYGTDARDPDTDNDGYSDGDEVAGGFNPLGSGKLNTGDQAIGEFSGISLEQVFSGEGDYVCTISLDRQDLPILVTLKVQGEKVRQEMNPNFANYDNTLLDSIVLIRNQSYVFFGNGEKESGWLKLAYSEDTKTWEAPGVSVSGGLFLTPEDVVDADPEKVECSETELQPSEFVVAPEYILQPGETYEEFQKKLGFIN